MALKGKALYDFVGDASMNELSFKTGDEITVLRQDVGEGWWEGQVGSAVGLFPETYVEIVSEDAGGDNSDWDEEGDGEEDWDNQAQNSGAGASAVGGYDEFGGESATDAGTGGFSDFKAGSTVGKAGTLRRSVNRFSGFVKVGGEAFMLGGLSDIQIDPSRMLHVSHTPGEEGLKWLPNPNSYGVIVVDHAGTRKKFHGLKEFDAYTISGGSANGSVERRHKHFVWLYERLRDKYSCICVPPMPDKQFMSKYGENLVQKRQQKLQQWLRRICRHPVLSRDELSLHHFLTYSSTDSKGWKKGKRDAESDKLIGGQFFKLISQDVPCPKDSDKEVDVFATFLKNLALSLRKNHDIALSHADRMSSGFKREYKRIGEGFLSLGQTEGKQGSGESTRLSMALVQCSKTYEDIAEMWASQPVNDQMPLFDSLKEFLGLVSQFNDGIGSCRAATEKVELIRGSQEATDKEKEAVKARRDVLHSLVLCEASHFHKQRREDFREMMKAYLQAQITFHNQISEKLQSAKAEFDKLNF